MPEGTRVDNETIQAFNDKVKDTLDKITNFVHILDDWVQEKIH
jgi:hypothetical protein